MSIISLSTILEATAIQGIRGIQGIQGTQGTQGLQGIQGIQGIAGAQGTQGTQGITGSQGTMTYPSAGVAISTGSAWSTSKTNTTGDFVGTTDTQTLTNKTLTDPIISLSGTNGTSGQALVSQGNGVAPAWGSVSSVITKTYTNRADLREVNGPSTLIAVVERLGVFAWEAGSTEVDDDETCFATSSGRWLLYAAAWDLVYEYIAGEIDILNEVRTIVETVSNTVTSLNANSSTSLTKNITGVELTDGVIVNPVLPFSNSADGSVSYFGYVTAPGQVTIYISNTSATSRNVNAGLLKILIVKGIN